MPPRYTHHAGVSNAIRYDSLLVRDLAAELDARLTGARIRAAFLDRRSLTFTLLVRAARRADAEPPSLRWQLHPDSGLIEAADTAGGGGRVQVRTGARITGVTAPPDERVLVIDLEPGEAPAGFARRFVVELVTNRWNALALGADNRIVAVLRERDTPARPLRAGATWALPPASDRIGAAHPVTPERWRAELGPLPPGKRMRALVRFAWASPLNGAWIIGDADVTEDAAALERAWDRYTRLVSGAVTMPVLLHTAQGAQPYGAPVDEHERYPSLLDAWAAAAQSRRDAPTVSAEDALALVSRRMDAVQRRMTRLLEEAAGAGREAAALRSDADLLMANLHAVSRGETSITLPDFEGGSRTLALEPGFSPADNARRMYDNARKRDRAAARIPRLVEQAEAELERLDALAGRIRDGAIPVEALAPLRSADRSADGDTPVLPYRVYRTSGGLEVRVGRGSKANDQLTFRHSSPSDVWLHARDVAGAHVILRWGRADENPPASQIEEAAVLAALFSRARTSGVVPVDWTRRRHVRKPRRAAPGLVIPERVRTVFVEPDPAQEERMRTG